ncbi:MAG: class I SAM-dependent methyltransferase [Nitrososphaerota archaeon]|nr:class I SAM-dependent methyltransferase [Thermoproteota archaeon]
MNDLREHVKKIISFFDELGPSRNIDEDVILNYEQRVRRNQLADLIERGCGFILDAGCGAGRDMIMILRAFTGEYIGVDISLQSLLVARRRAFEENSTNRVNLIRADVNFLPFREQIFDQVLCCEVLEHIPSWRKAVRELYRVLKVRGSLIVSAPNTLSIYYPQKLYLERKYGTVHPYDQWKNTFLMKRVLKGLSLIITDVRGACILPGHICYTKFGKKLIRPLLPLLERIERVLCSKTPLRYFSYICIIKAVKVHSSS